MKIDLSDPVNRSHPLNRGLVSWWLALPDQQRGVMFRDLCGRNHGVLTNMDPATDWVGPRGRVGGWASFDLDGSNDHVNCGNISSAIYSGDFTQAFWIRLAADGNYFILDKRASASDGLVTEFFSGGLLRLRSDGSIVNISGATELSGIVGSWSHIAVTRAGSTLTGYLNGSATTISGTDSSNASNANPQVIGTRSFSTPANTVSGLMDDVRIHAKAWSTAEVREYYNLSRRHYPGLLNRVPRRYYSVQDAVVGGTILPQMLQHYYGSPA